MPYNSVAYVREAGGPGELEKHVADIQGSGLTTVILSRCIWGGRASLRTRKPAISSTTSTRAT